MSAIYDLATECAAEILGTQSEEDVSAALKYFKKVQAMERERLKRFIRHDLACQFSLANKGKCICGLEAALKGEE